MAGFSRCNGTLVYVHVGKHSGDCKRTEKKAAKALQQFCGLDGRIPVEDLGEANRAAVLATDRQWSSVRIARLMEALRMAPPPDYHK